LILITGCLEQSGSFCFDSAVSLLVAAIFCKVIKFLRVILEQNNLLLRHRQQWKYHHVHYVGVVTGKILSIFLDHHNEHAQQLSRKLLISKEIG